MYFSYTRSKRLIFISMMAIQLLLIRSVSSLNLTNEYLNHKCLVSQGKYKPGSEYEKNLNSLFNGISSLPYRRDGFFHSTVTDTPNTVTVIFQCRGDSYESKCRSCAATAVAGFRRRCPRNKGGIIWYDQCFLDVNMINDPVPRKNNYENVFSMHNPNNLRGDTESFNKMTSDFLHELIIKADRPRADGLGFLYFAAGEKNYGTNKLYAMVQCAQDVMDCKGCLEWSIRELSKCCNGKQGARVLGTLCNLRYELYPFIRNETL